MRLFCFVFVFILGFVILAVVICGVVVFSNQILILFSKIAGRYMYDLIYTHVGDILIAVNPFRNIIGLYG